MTFRCKNCQATVWLQTTASTTSVRCTGCRQRYQIDSRRRSRIDRRGLSVRARNLAKREALDLPGSYSVLLGIMTAEEVRELGCTGSVACAAGPTRAEASGAQSIDYDPAFRPAVLLGSLTAKQALERGQREVYSTFLADRHRLPKKIAYLVADNRISLLEAVRRHRKQSDGAMRLTPPMPLALPSSRTGVLLSVLSVSLLSFVYFGSGTTDPARPARVRQVGPARVETDVRGRVVRVQGPSPQSVLNAYCESGGPNDRLEPLQVAAHSSRGARARLGLFLDRTEPSTLLAIAILEDRDANFWFSGDGRQPLVAFTAPDGAERAIVRTRSVAQSPFAFSSFGASLQGGFGIAPQSSR